MNNYIGLFSGGKDSLVACHYMKLDEVLYCKTGVGLEENYNYVQATCKKYNWKLNVVEPKENESYADFVRKFGFPHSGIHSAIMGFLKYHPMRKFARQNKCIFVTGRRRKESRRRMRIQKTQTEKVDGMTFYSPLFDWTTRQVWDYINENNLDICPVYKTLHLSGDCLCGSFSESGEAELIATFHPDMAERIKQLEQEYKGRWGNQSSMTGALKQDKIVNYVCTDCIQR